MAKKKRGGKGRFKSKRALSAQIGLGSLINKAQKDSSFRNDPAPASSVIQDMPQKFQDFIGRNLRPDGTMNSAALAIFNQYDDGRSEFQRELNRNIQSNPQFAQAYAERFPKTNLAMKGLPMLFKGIGSAVAPGFGLVAEMFQGTKDTASNIGTTLRESFQPTIEGIKELLTPNLRSSPTTDTALNVKGDGIDIFTPDVQKDFASAPDLSFASNQDMQRIFAFPRGMGARLPSQGTLGNYLVSDPGGLLRMANMPVSTQKRGFADGGIASLQDPNYNLLMEASDFSL